MSEWLPASTAPQSGWFIATNWAMAQRDRFVVAKRDRRRNGSLFTTSSGGRVLANYWAPIPPVTPSMKTQPRKRKP